MGKRKHRFKWSRLRIVLLAVAGAYALFTFVSHQPTMSAALERREELLSEQQSLQHQLDYHEHEMEFIGSEEYIEQEARERLGWLKPGETKYVDSSSSEPPREKVSVEPTVTPSVPGPRRTERPAVVPSPVRTAAAVPSQTPEPSAAGSPDAANASDDSEPAAAPTATPTPKSIG